MTPAIEGALNALAAALKADKPFSGEFVLLQPGEMVTDPQSGITYCDREAWEKFRAAIPDRSERPASKTGSAS